MKALDQHHPVEAVEEVHRARQVEPLLEEHVHGAGAAEDEGEAEHPDEGRRDDRDHGQVAEQPAPGEVAADEQEGDGDPQHRGGDHGGRAQDQRVPQRAQVEPVGEEVGEVGQGEVAGPVRHRVVEDPHAAGRRGTPAGRPRSGPRRGRRGPAAPGPGRPVRGRSPVPAGRRRAGRPARSAVAFHQDDDPFAMLSPPERRHGEGRRSDGRCVRPARDPHPEPPAA